MWCTCGVICDCVISALVLSIRLIVTIGTILICVAIGTILVFPHLRAIFCEPRSNTVGNIKSCSPLGGRHWAFQPAATIIELVKP